MSRPHSPMGNGPFSKERWKDDLEERVFIHTLDLLEKCRFFAKGPKIFVVYAHENSSTGLQAYEKEVKKLIGWFQKAGVDVHSDQSPDGYRTPIINAPDSVSVRNILENQFCLLPRDESPRTADLILLCGSEIVGEYLKDSQYEEYQKELYDAFSKPTATRQDGTHDVSSNLRKALRAVFEKWSKKIHDFHHLHTELAMLYIRHMRRTTGKPADVIPLQLDKQDYKKCFPHFIHGDDSILRVEMFKKSPYMIFFKLLGMFNNEVTSFIKEIGAIHGEWKLRLDSEKALSTGATEAPNSEPLYMDYMSRITVAVRDMLSKLAPHIYPQIEVYTLTLVLREIRRSYSIFDSISGRTLPLDSSYIDLQMKRNSKEQENSISEEKADRTPPLSLDAFLKETLYADSTESWSKRVLILGQAGAGKSTLCARIAYKFDQEERSKRVFDWVLLIPLHKLESSNSLQDFLRHEYFQFAMKGRELAEMLCEKIIKSKTLLVLDGWDKMRGRMQDKVELVNRLVKHCAFIITSRSSNWHASTMIMTDQEYEVLGFAEDQVTKYLNKRDLVPSKADSSEIKTFIQSNRHLQGFFQIPIHLDALCYSWNAWKWRNQENGQLNKDPTVTTLYQAITDTLWRKNIPGLQKVDRLDGSVLTEEIVNEIRDPRRLECCVEYESDFLGGLAMKLMKENRTEYYDKDIENFVRMGYPQDRKLPLSMERNLAKLSFLHSNKRSQQQSYSFIHLTFQEFFAALWLTRNPSKLEQHVREFKYRRSFNLVWRFVTGLLQANLGNEELYRFFNMIQAEPRDVLGPSHHRLVMHCLNEMVPSVKDTKLAQLQSQLEDQLLQGLLFECKFGPYSSLAREVEFPEPVVCRVFLDEAYKDMRGDVAKSLHHRPKFDTRFKKAAVGWLSQTPQSSRKDVVDLLKASDPLPKMALKDLTDLLKGGNVDNQEDVLDILAAQSNLSEETLDVLADRLDAKDKKVTSRIFNILRMKSTLSERIYNFLTTSLENGKDFSQLDVVEVLRDKRDIPTRTLGMLVKLLEHRDSVVKEKTILTLAQSPLPRETLLSLMEMLQSGNIDSRREVARVLSIGHALPDDIVEQLTKLLGHRKTAIKENAIWALLRQSALPDGTVDILIGLLKNQAIKVIESAVKVLSYQSALSDKALTALAAILDYEKEHINNSTEVLRNQPELPGNIVNSLLGSLMDSNTSIREDAAEILRKQPKLPGNIVDSLLGLLTDSDTSIREAAAKILREQSSLEYKTVKALLEQIEHSNEAIRSHAVGILREQQELPRENLDELLESLKHSDIPKIRHAIKGLSTQSILPREAIDSLTELLKHGNIIVIRDAIKILSVPSRLSEKAINILMGLLEHRDISIIRGTIEALGTQSELSAEAVNALTSLLKDKRIGIIKNTIKALGTQSKLPAEAINALTSLLKDRRIDIIENTIKALGTQSKLSAEAVNTLTSLLKHRNIDIVKNAIKTLGIQSKLPAEAINTLVELLEHRNIDIIKDIIEALANQSKLPAKAIDALAKLLKYRNINTKIAAFPAPDDQSNFQKHFMNTPIEIFLSRNNNSCSRFAKISKTSIQMLYEIWLKRSFTSHVSFYFEGNTAYIETHDGRQDIFSKDDSFKKVILSANASKRFKERRLA